MLGLLNRPAFGKNQRVQVMDGWEVLVRKRLFSKILCCKENQTLSDPSIKPRWEGE